MHVSIIAGMLQLAGAPAAAEAPVVVAPITAVKPPVPVQPLERLFSPMDYPAGAQSSGAERRVDVALLVSPAGRVSGCVIRVSSGSGLLDATTCRILQSRARFHPAQDEDGKATMASFLFSKEWKAPASKPGTASRSV